jgi:hypothetical protein
LCARKGKWSRRVYVKNEGKRVEQMPLAESYFFPFSLYSVKASATYTVTCDGLRGDSVRERMCVCVCGRERIKGRKKKKVGLPSERNRDEK